MFKPLAATAATLALALVIGFANFGGGSVFDRLGINDVRIELVIDVAEPETWALLMGGLGLVIVGARRRRRGGGSVLA